MEKRKISFTYVTCQVISTSIMHCFSAGYVIALVRKMLESDKGAVLQTLKVAGRKMGFLEEVSTAVKTIEVPFQKKHDR